MLVSIISLSAAPSYQRSRPPGMLRSTAGRVSDTVGGSWRSGPIRRTTVSGPRRCPRVSADSAYSQGNRRNAQP
jgi:hypothetical protein